MAASPAPAAKARIFHGWWIVGSVFVTQAISAGLTSYSFGLFQLPVAEEFGVSRSVVSLGMTGAMLLGALMGPVVGRALDTRPNRTLMLAAGTTMPAAFGEVMDWMSPVMLPLDIVGIQLLPGCDDSYGSYLPRLQVCLAASACASSAAALATAENCRLASRLG